MTSNHSHLQTISFKFSKRLGNENRTNRTAFPSGHKFSKIHALGVQELLLIWASLLALAEADFCPGIIRTRV